MRVLRTIVRHPLLLLAGVGLALACNAGVSRLTFHRAVALPSLLYQVEATSGSHQVTLAGLPITPVGVVAVPTPVDVNGDLLPDVLVSVNLVNVSGLFANPPGTGQVIAPNLTITRILPGAPLEPVSLPLRIDVKLTLINTSGQVTYVRLGYDTGVGGSIPNSFKVVANGITNFFNPLQAQVTTTGYEGPLTLVAGTEDASGRTDADARFMPLPTGLTFSYSTDSAGTHIGVQHDGRPGAPNADIDLSATVTSPSSSATAQIDRLPHSVALTVQPGAGDGSGGFDYVATESGRLPDLTAHYVGNGPSHQPLVADLNVVGLPSELHGSWSLAPSKPAAVHFAAPREAVGAIDATVALAPGADHLVRYVAGARQYLSLQEGATSERLVTGHIEGIRLVDFAETASGFNGHFEADGVGSPLEVHADLTNVGDSKWAVTATNTVDPLPNDVTVALAAAGVDEIAQPTTLTYTSSSSVDVKAHAELRKPAAVGQPCGAKDTVCGDLQVFGIPGQITARLSQVDAKDSTPGEFRLAVDTTSRPGASLPDLIADTTVGTDSEPVVAHARVLGVPPHLRIREVDGANGTTAHVQFNACDVDYGSDMCPGNTTGSVGSLEFGVRDFITRPANLPVATLKPDNSIAVVGQGEPDGSVAFEALGRVNGASEVQYVDDNVIGIRTQIGAGGALNATLDLVGVPIAANDLADIHATTTVAEVPSTFDFCLQQAGEPIRQTAISLPTTECEKAQPFGPDVPVTASPLSIHYDASAPIDVSTDARFVDHGTSPDVSDDTVGSAHVDITNLPADATLHVLTPDDGSVRAAYDTGTSGPAATGPTVINFSASLADGDLVCSDPRVPKVGASVSCISGTIKGLPGNALVTFFPDQATDNLAVHTDTPIGLPTLSVSSVKGVADGSSSKADVLRATLSIPTLPTDLSGTIHSSPTAIDLQVVCPPQSPPDCTPTPIPQIDATVATFIAPDPLPAAPPAPPTDVPPVVNPDTFSVFQRGDDVRADAHLTNLVSGGYQEASNGVKVVNVGFGEGKSVRAYVDLDDGSSQVIGDATVVNLPTALSLCFRGAPTSGGPALGTFCERSTADKGAFEFRATAHSPAPFDIYSYFRDVTQSGADILAGKVDIDGIPDVVEGEIGSGGVVTFRGFSLRGLPLGKGGLAPAGIGRIAAHVATFDLYHDNLFGIPVDDSGYTNPPFSDPVFRHTDPFPAPQVSNEQQLAFAADDNNMEARVLLGPPNPGDPGSSLESLSLSPAACAAPAGRADYPEYPQQSGAPYTCLQTAFSKTGGPVALYLGIKKSGTRIVLHDATLDSLPAWLQVTLSSLDGKTDDPSNPFLPTCGPAAASSPGPSGSDPSCVPPMVRYDSASNAGDDLSGVFEVGSTEQLLQLSGLGDRAGDLPPLDATPTSTWNDAQCATNHVAEQDCIQNGVRAAVATVQGDSVVRVGFRIPVPDELTFDPIEKWSKSLAQTPAQNQPDVNYSAENLTIHFAAKVDGTDLPNLGRLDAVIQDTDLSQMVVTDGFENESVYSNGVQRVPTGIPGELDASIYLRNNKEIGRNYVEVDGTVNQDTDLRLRLVPAPVPQTPDSFLIPPLPATVVDLAMLRLPAPTAAAPGSPSFRLEADIVSPPLPAAPPQNTQANDPCASAAAIEASCNTNTTAGVPDVGAILDFHTDDGTRDGPLTLPDRPVRLLQAVVRTANGYGGQLKAFADVAGTMPARISGEMFVDVDPLHIHTSGQLSILNYQVDFSAAVHTKLILNRVSDVSIGESAGDLHIDNAKTDLNEGDVDVVPDVDLTEFHGDGDINLGWLGDLDVLGVDFYPIADGIVANKFVGCNQADPDQTTTPVGFVDPFVPIDQSVTLLGLIGSNTAEVHAGDPKVFEPLPDEQGDGRWFVTAFDVPFFPGGWMAALWDNVAPCNDPGNALGKPPLPAGAQYPANTLTAFPVPILTGLPPSPVDATAQPPAPLAGQAEPLSVTIPADQQPVQECGSVDYDNLVVEGILETQDPKLTSYPSDATTLPNCPLNIQANTVEVKPGGVIKSFPLEDGDITITANSITVDGATATQPGGLIEIKGPHPLPDNADGHQPVFETEANRSGGITLHASQNVTIGAGGSIDADALELAPVNGGSDPQGSAGGSHGGQGGNDSSAATAGSTYGDPSNTALDVEGGSVGGPYNELTPPVGGFGGGTVEVIAPQVDIDGTVSANGQDGPSDCSGTVNGAGSGGGSGGGIEISADSVTYDIHGGDDEITPRPGLFASGGNGGSGPNGGGGGGGGGIIKVLAPDVNVVPDFPPGQTPELPTPAPGLGGNATSNPSDCADAAPTVPQGDSGSAGTLITNTAPESHVLPFSQFWQSDAPSGAAASDLKVPFSATSGPADGGTFTVHTCGIYLDRSWENELNTSTNLNTGTNSNVPAGATNGLPNPSSFPDYMPGTRWAGTPTSQNPCGTPTVEGLLGPLNPVPFAVPLDLASATYPDGPLEPSAMGVSLTDLCTTLKQAFPVSEASCPNGFWGLWTTVVRSDGTVEPAPASPDAVIGIDDQQPFQSIVGITDTTPGSPSETEVGDSWFTRSRDISFDLDTSDEAGNLPPLSLLATTTCTESSTTDPTTYEFPCQGGIGAAGVNQYHLQTKGDGLKTITVHLTDGAGNVNSPNPSLGGCDSSTLPFCPTAPVLNITLDVRPPGAELVNLPPPTGHNGWYTKDPPLVIGSTGDPANSDGSPGAGVNFGSTTAFGVYVPPPAAPFEYRIDDYDKQDCGVLQFFHTCTVTGFPTLGTHTLYYTAVDAVGNRITFPGEDPQVPFPDLLEPPFPVPPPGQITLKVDGQAPVTSLATVPAAKNSTNRFTTDPLIVLNGFDQPDGSGLVNPPGSDIAGFYYQVFPHSGPPAETHYSVPFQLGDGDHTVCWRGFDVAGNTDVGGTAVPAQSDYPADHCYSYSVDTQPPTVRVTGPLPNGGGGWFKTPPAFSLSATDPGGSGVAHLFVSEDGGSFLDCPAPLSFSPCAAPFMFGAGTHTLEWYATDNFGNSSLVQQMDVDVDLSPPAVEARVVPPLPALAPWWRHPVTVAIDATDGSQNSGVASIEYRVDNGLWSPYTTPIQLGAGEHTVGYRATDVAGWTQVGSPLTVFVDGTPPIALAGAPSPTVWNPAAGPATATLRYAVGDDHSTAVHVYALIINSGGDVVRTVDGGSVPVQPGGPTAQGSVSWDGRDDSGKAVVGFVTYRIVAVDQAGNLAQSGESRPIQIVGGVLLLPCCVAVHVLVDLGGL